jgi:hypothetical protein
MTTESLLTRIPENSSFLQATKFTFVFPTLPYLRYFCQTVSIPSVSTSAIEVPTPFSNTYRHGTTLRYEDFSVNCIVDEDLRVWEETYNWLKGLTRPTNFGEYITNRDRGDLKNLYHDGFLTVNTNANIPNIRFKFKDCHPVSLGAIQFNTTDNAENTITVDITFRYDHFTLDRF